MTVDYAFVALNGAEELELVNASSRSLRWHVDGAGELMATLDARDEGPAALVKHSSDILVYRDGDLIQRVKYLDDPLELDGPSGGRHTLTAIGLDYRGLLDEVARLPASTTFAATDQGEIAWSLIDAYQSRPGGNRGITNGAGQTSGTLRDRTFDAGAPVGKLIGDLGRVDGGFEWEIDANLALNRFYPTRGSAGAGTLDYGGAISRAVRSRGIAFRNAWTVPGAPGTSPASSVAADVAVDARGRWEGSQAFPSIKEQATLDARADYLLDVSTATNPGAWTLTLERGVWGGPTDLFIGDRFDLSIVTDEAGVIADGPYRIITLEVTLGSTDADEVVKLGVIPA